MKATRPSTADIRRKRTRLLFERGPFCSICGKLIIKGRVTLDHRVSLQHHGSSSLDNLELAHGPCNVAKGGGKLRRPPAPPERPSCTWCVDQVEDLRCRTA